MIFAPTDAAPGKLAAMRAHGAEVVREGDDCVVAESAARAYAAEHGLAYISPYNDPAVVAGQGTLGRELVRQLEHFDAVFVSVGGGGLIGGVGSYLRGSGRFAAVVGASPRNSAVMHASLEAGELLDLPSKPTLSDGTAGGVEEGSITFDLCRNVIDDFVLVDEPAIADGVRQVVKHEHTLVEGGCGHGGGRDARAGGAVRRSPRRRRSVRGEHRLRRFEGAALMSERPRVAEWSEIAGALERVDLLAEIERGFVAYSAGRCVIPPVGELLFEEPPGEVHLKYGYVKGEESYVVKIASGFARNADADLPTGNGMMLLFRQSTGEPMAVLLDEGRLTDLRTAAAGAVSARLLSPPRVERIGVFGSGVQARRQLELLREVVECREVSLWARHPERREACASDLRELGFQVETVSAASDVASSCNLLITTTAATAPLFSSDAVRPGTHVTAVGSDTVDKQELDAALLARADLVVADSLSQCEVRGEISQGMRAGVLDLESVVELGAVLGGTATGRTDESQITVCDLTGVAVQDAQIAWAVYSGLGPE